VVVTAVGAALDFSKEFLALPTEEQSPRAIDIDAKRKEEIARAEQAWV